MSAYSFFLICPLDLEQICLDELNEKSQDLELFDVEHQHGGISFKASLGHGCALNHRLRTPTRLLCHLEQFKARDLPKIFQKTSKIPWRNWLHDGPFQWKVSASKSRLIHTTRIAQTLKEAVEKSFSHQAPKKRSAHLSADFIPTLYARLEDDIAHLSLDLSGEALSKRGQKIFSHAAPLRENLAQCLWRYLSAHLESSVKTLELCDPMAGSGTFLFEAKHAYENNFQRIFAYQYIPQTIHFPKNDLPARFEISRLVACDLDVESLTKNAQAIFADKSSPLEIIKGDCFQQNLEKPVGTRVILSNPPYGERIKKEFKVAELLDLYQNKWRADYVGVLAPSSWDFEAHLEKKQILGKLKFKNGALPVCFWVIKIGHTL